MAGDPFYDAGAAIHGFFARNAASMPSPWAQATQIPGIGAGIAAVPAFASLARGAINGPAAAPVMHPAIAAALGQPVAPPVPVTPLTGDSVAAYGQLSPAARAVLSNVNPGAVQAADKINADKTTAALQGVPTWAQMMAGYAAGHGGQISLRAIDALAGAAAKGAQAGSATRKLPSIADVAGQQALQLGTELFNQQKDDAIKSGDKNAYLKAALEHQDRLERLARARAIDPVTEYGLSGGAGGN